MKLLTTIFVTALCLAACSGNGGDNDPNGDRPLTISGTLSQTTARATDATTQSFTATVGTDEKTLTGRLKDGTVIFELTGFYEPQTREFFMSAPSSGMIFTIAGTLTKQALIDPAATYASVRTRNQAGEWSTTDLAVAPSADTIKITEPVNAITMGMTTVPAYLRGQWVDQIGPKRTYNVTSNSIVSLPARDFTIVEVANANGTAADESGPWDMLVRATWVTATDSIPFTGKFYVSKTFDQKLQEGIGGQHVSDLFFGEDMEEAGRADLLKAIPALGTDMRAYIAPYCSEENVDFTGIYPATGWSPLFTGNAAAANARAATELKAVSGFTLVLK